MLRCSHHILKGLLNLNLNLIFSNLFYLSLLLLIFCKIYIFDKPTYTLKVDTKRELEQR